MTAWDFGTGRGTCRTLSVHRRIDAPPASAIAARLDRTTSTRIAMILAISRTYQPFPPNSSVTSVPSCAVFVLRNTKTDLTLRVGRLHYWLDAAPSAHFRRRVSASERLNNAS
jgi:hypothetical protein